jgi:hypothetical protein
MTQPPTPKSVVDAIERLLGPRPIDVQYEPARGRSGAFVATIEGTEWLVPADRAAGSVDLAVRDTFFCSRCDERLEADPITRTQDVHGRSMCRYCAFGFERRKA